MKRSDICNTGNKNVTLTVCVLVFALKNSSPVLQTFGILRKFSLDMLLCG